MFISFFTLSLTSAFFAQFGAALEIDVKDQNSIKGAAKTLAGSIVDVYKSDLQKDLIPGLFSYPYYWWEAGAVFGSLVDYSYLTGDNQYNQLLVEGFEHQLGDNAFMPSNQTKSLGNDDQSTWGLAAMSAAENSFTPSTVGDLPWVTLASNVFDTQKDRWNNMTCNGGLNWQIYQFNKGFTYKNAITNGNFFLLAARLAKFTGNATYSEWAEKSFEWAQSIGLVSEDYHVYDGTDDTTNCTVVSKLQWSSDIGIYTEAAAHMWNVTGGGDKWKKVVSGLVNTTRSFFSDDDILTEAACESEGHCNIDQRAFKGLAARSFARAIVAAPFISDALTPMLQASAKGAAQSCGDKASELDCKLSWKNRGNTNGSLSETFSALAVVQALLLPEAKPLATGSTSNGTSSGSPSENAPAASGSGKPAQNEGAAGSLVVSRSLAVAVAVLAAAFL